MSGPAITTAGSGLPTRLVFHGVEGVGKCLGRGTPVLMFDGKVKPVEEVAEGELLMGPDSRPRRVSGLHAGFGALYRVTPTKGESYVVNQRHVLSLKMSRRHGHAFHEVVNIPVEDYLRRSRSFRRDALGWRVGVEWPEKVLPLDPYLLGCWLGDGTASKPEITTPEEEVVAGMGTFAASAGIKVRAGARAGTATTFSLAGPYTGGTVPNPFTAHLRRLAVLNDKHVPHDYKTGSRSQRLEVLAGLLDTDGHLVHNCFEITQKRERLADDILFLARSLGFAAYRTVCEKVCTNSPTQAVGIYHRILISGDVDALPTRVWRKTGGPRRQIKDVTVTGVTVQPCGTGDYFGFELDGDHLFLLGDFTVTHNTSFAACAPAPVFAMTRGETGLLTLIDAGQVPPTPHFDECASWADLLAAVRHLLSEGGAYRTFVLDTLNGAERLCLEHVCREQFEDSWAAFGSYGRGVEQAQAEWHSFLSLLDSLRAARKMAVVCLCHTKVKAFRNPLGEDFDRYAPDMHDKFWGLSAKWADVVLFGNFDVKTRRDKGAPKAKAAEALAVSRRVLHTVRTAAWDAKNRTGLPPQIGMGRSAREAWDNFLTAMRGGKPATPQAPPTPRGPSAGHRDRPAARGASPAPRPGEKLLARLQAHELELVAAGRCGPGDLLGHVRAAGTKAGRSANVNEWAGGDIAFAVAEVAAFDAAHPPPGLEPDLAALREAAEDAGYASEEALEVFVKGRTGGGTAALSVAGVRAVIAALHEEAVEQRRMREEEAAAIAAEGPA